MNSEGKLHIVKDGDSAESLAVAHGLFWETVWLHPENAALRQRRRDHNVLLPGDELFIPPLEPKTESRDTDAKHTFTLKGVPSELNVQFQDLHGEPYNNESYKLLVDGELIEGSLNGEGRLIMPIAPEVRRIHVEIGADGELAVCDLYVGHLDPIDELTGIQARLLNLGFFSGGVDGKPSEALNDAIAEFRVAHGLDEAPQDDPDDDSFANESEQGDDAESESPPDDEPDDPTPVRGNDDDFRNALRDAHGT